jgi:CDP-glucose 4,6-dehydratase
MKELREFFKGKRVLITGHTGFKGAWLAQILHLWGAEVVGVSLRPHTKPNLFTATHLKDRVKTYFVDIRDFKKLKAIFKKEKPEIVFHLAAQAIVRTSYDKPKETHEINVMGTVNVLECIRAEKSVKASVIVTTDKVYDPDNRRGDKFYKEDDRIDASDHYGSSKAAADIIARTYIKHGLNAAVVRAGNVMGGGDWGVDRIIVDVMRAKYENQPLLLRNPTAVRPWQHVLEPVSGYLMLAKELYGGNAKMARAWNFGPYVEAHQSVEYIAKSLIGQNRYKIIPDVSKPETLILQLDPIDARRHLNWNPKLELKEALQMTEDWYKKFYEQKTNMIEFTNQQISQYFNR